MVPAFGSGPRAMPALRRHLLGRDGGEVRKNSTHPNCSSLRDCGALFRDTGPTNGVCDEEDVLLRPRLCAGIQTPEGLLKALTHRLRVTARHKPHDTGNPTQHAAFKDDGR